MVRAARTGLLAVSPFIPPIRTILPAYRWYTADRTVRIGQSEGVSIIFTIIGTPAWSKRSAGWSVAPTVMNDLRQFVFAATRRYSGKFTGPDGNLIPAVRSWIAWNEPNNPVFLKPQFKKVAGRWVFQPPRTMHGSATTS